MNARAAGDARAYIPTMKKLLGIILLFSALAASQIRPEDGGHEIQLWTGGGHSVSGGRASTGVWNLGFRYGWILTRPHGPGFLSGRLEYALDAVPVFLIFQPVNTAYGAGFNPLNLKWNFATRGTVVPYFELSGGTLFTNHDVPAGTNTVNFTPSAALGTHFLREEYNWSVELRYMHISNAGLEVHNPGLNTLQVRIGIGKFFSHPAGRKR
jgi:Lipid A 3-O-deacylase (PagL)